ncbi:GNAT family N-acetyltransferase [Radiobacillus sp. PE A8.2]|uniref:GNAT family N-acetyltransferase n=1 Tax=Radiobacillus sp. PE A8.2 TaxID=3380349 RepID=UPI00388D449E
MSFHREWADSGEDMIPWFIKKDPSNFPAMVQDLATASVGEGLPEGWVPDSAFWLVNHENRVLGAVSIRHQLTELLMNSGGHIGYGIRPSERRKGYATKLLQLALQEAKKLHIDRALVVCDAWNTGSEKTICNNGGIPDLDCIEEDGNVIKRFWITVE